MPKNDLKFLQVSYNSGIILSKMFTYYSQNYAGIIYGRRPNSQGINLIAIVIEKDRNTLIEQSHSS